MPPAKIAAYATNGAMEYQTQSERSGEYALSLFVRYITKKM